MFYRLRCFCLVFFLGLFVQCGESSGNNSNTSTDTTELAVFMQWAGVAWDSLNLFLDNDETLTFPLACPGGGSMDEEGSEIAINDCIVSSETTTYLGRGTYTITESGSLVTHAWDQDLIVDDDITFSSTGSISFDTLDGLIAFDFVATFDDVTYRITGIVAINGDGTSNLTLSVLEDGTSLEDCAFTNTDLSALTSETIDGACEEDTEEDCTTLECANDFQCQLFADDDSDDDFETGNTQCVDGCCALVGGASTCGEDTISCTSDFQCQLFADDDTTDAFETDNVECSEGCCALISE